MSNKIELYDVIIKSSIKAIYLQKNDGSMPPGHNGVRFDPETPVRNTGHWLISFLKAYEITNEKKFLFSAERAVNYLLSKNARPMGATFWHRKKPEKDFCNGLMGQAFSIEALAIAYDILKIPECLRVAEEVFLLHPFDENVGVWQRVGVDGSYLSFDGTFNHQLWFAAAGGLLKNISDEPIIKHRIDTFMSKLNNTLSLYCCGLIRHPLITNNSSAREVLNNTFKMISSYKKKKIKHAIGYHNFNMYALAILKQVYSNHPFWKSAKFKAVLNYMMSDKFWKTIIDESFSMPHNPAGFDTAFIEMIYALHTFTNSDKEKLEELLTIQFQRTFNFEDFLMNKRTVDPLTQAARLYKATRLPNLLISV